MSETRFYADRFDAEGTYFVFDDESQGSECAGPFSTLAEAEHKARELNLGIVTDCDPGDESSGSVARDAQDAWDREQNQ
jgi:hypothetical protein